MILQQFVFQSNPHAERREAPPGRIPANTERIPPEYHTKGRANTTQKEGRTPQKRKGESHGQIHWNSFVPWQPKRQDTMIVPLKPKRQETMCHQTPLEDAILVNLGWVARNRALLMVNTCLLLCTINNRCTTDITKCRMLSMTTSSLLLCTVNDTNCINMRICTINAADPTQCASWLRSILAISDTFPLYVICSSFLTPRYLTSSFLTPHDLFSSHST